MRDASDSETYIMTPDLKEERNIVPTAPMTKAGPALTEERTILFASFCVILFWDKSVCAIEQPTGKPPHKPKKITLPAVPESFKIFLQIFSVFLPITSRTPLDVAKAEITRKGKRDGIMVFAQISRPFLIPSAESVEYFRMSVAGITQKIQVQIIFSFLFNTIFFKIITYTIYEYKF